MVQGDLPDAEALGSVLAAGVEGVLHFAARSVVRESVEHPERYYRTNVCGTLNLLDTMREASRKETRLLLHGSRLRRAPALPL